MTVRADTNKHKLHAKKHKSMLLLPATDDRKFTLYLQPLFFFCSRSVPSKIFYNFIFIKNIYKNILRGTQGENILEASRKFCYLLKKV